MAKGARASLPDYEEATTGVRRHIRATPRGAPNTTTWGLGDKSRGVRRGSRLGGAPNATLLEDKRAAAELAFHLFDPSLNCASRRTSRT